MTAEWEGPAVVLSARPHGESGAVVTLLTEALGRHPGLARGGQSRAQSALWQVGNLVEARWVARLADQLGTVSGELVHPAAAMAMDDPLALDVLLAACAVADGALPEREPHLAAFHGLVALVVELARAPERAVESLVRWEAGLLAELGYGLDFSACAATGVTEGLAWVSPRTGRAVSAEAGAPYVERLLALPAFLLDDSPGSAADWLAGLRLTAHFLERDAFGQHHRPLPPPRLRLEERVAGLASS
ncbi:MAG: DNA repair protein RecO [Alphaproteobacteria bacterium]|nr:DNA repair protein RecO [Alphaproteobacteria bacterium]